MKVLTKNFGEIEIEESKAIYFQGGIIGFPDLTNFVLIHDEERGSNAGLQWLQSMQETTFAMPVLNPLLVLKDYQPSINDELLVSLGDFQESDLFVLVTASIPSDITEMTVNLKGPIVINTKSNIAVQVIVENAEYVVKFPIYEILKSRKAGQ